MKDTLTLSGMFLIIFRDQYSLYFKANVAQVDFIVGKVNERKKLLSN